MSNYLSKVIIDNTEALIKDSEARSGISNINASIASMKTRLAKTQKLKIITVGDSYAADGDWEKWPYKLKKLMGIADQNFHNCAKNGYGFNSLKPMHTVLQEYSDTLTQEQKNSVDIIIACCGANDFDYANTIDVINGEFSRFKNITDTFQNAKVYIGMIGSCIPQLVTGSWQARVSISKIANTIGNYKQCARNCHFSYLDDAERWARPDCFASDYVHPNEAGSLEIANKIYSALFGGFTNNFFEITLSGDDYSKIPNLKMSMKVQEKTSTIWINLNNSVANPVGISNLKVKTNCSLIPDGTRLVYPLIVCTKPNGSNFFTNGYFIFNFDNGELLIQNRTLNPTGTGYNTNTIYEYIGGPYSYTIPIL